MLTEDYSDYLKAVEGEGFVPHPVRWAELRPHVDNLHIVVDQAVQRIFAHKQRKRGEPKGPSAWQWVEENVTVRVPDHIPHRRRRRFQLYVESHLMRLVLDQAKQDTRYWGVEDPTKECYCSHCKRALPIENFEGSNVTCTSCSQQRRRRGER